jgi:hypothetical protein
MTMKKLGLIIVVLLSFVLLTNKTMATCPDGLSQRTNRIMINGCAYDVDICYKCITLDGIVRVMVNGIIKVDPNCNQSWTWNQVIQGVFNIVYGPNYIRDYVCNSLPPCTDPPTGIPQWFSKPLCWFKLKVDQSRVKLFACEGSSSCITKWLICWDTQLGREQRTLVEGPVLDFPSTCPIGPEPPDPVNIGEFSECFTVSTPCNP